MHTISIKIIWQAPKACLYRFLFVCLHFGYHSALLSTSTARQHSPGDSSAADTGTGTGIGSNAKSTSRQVRSIVQSSLGSYNYCFLEIPAPRVIDRCINWLTQQHKYDACLLLTARTYSCVQTMQRWKREAASACGEQHDRCGFQRAATGLSGQQPYACTYSCS